MGKGRRLLIVAGAVTMLAMLTVGFALAQGSSGPQREGHEIHVIFGPGSQAQFLDFAGDGLGFGDRLASVGPLLDEHQARRVGTAYLDCVIESRMLEGGTFDCTYVLSFADGSITTQGIDPQGPSDVLFAITGGTGAHEGANGQARYVDTDVTDIIIELEG